ncbi:feoA domain protein [Clostridium sp. CAG:575]|nr:feoA domain protein [Clostridium sp. CAG:575]
MNRMSLDKLPINIVGKVNDIKCVEGIKRRLLDLGIIKGTKIEPVLLSPSGDPRAFSVRGTLIAIRKEDAENIEVIL